MAHPNKAEGIRGHNAKLQRMTRGYGAAGGPSQYRVARENQPKGNAAADHPEDDPGFGVDPAGATPRSDRPARRAAPGNAVASYRRGGHVKGKRRAPGGATFNYGQSDMAASQQAMNKANQQNKPQGGQQGGKGLIPGLVGSGSGPDSAGAGLDPSARRGGRIRHRALGGGLAVPSSSKSSKKGGKGKTNISINIAPAAAPTGVSGPLIGANPAMPPPMPPRPPMMPPPGAGGPPPAGMPPGGPPGMSPGPLGQLALQQKAAGLLPRKHGGRIPHDDEKADRQLVQDMVKQDALKGRRSWGGSVLKGKGAESGEGRLNRNHHMGRLGMGRAHGGGVLKAAGAESGPGRLNRNHHMDHKLKPTRGVTG